MSDPLDLIEARLVKLGKTCKRRGDKLDAQCPAHDDRDPSFGVTYGTHRDIVMKCLAGCDNDAILTALGLEWTDFGDHSAPAQEVTYDYTDSAGRLVYQVVRGWKNGAKTFNQRQPAPGGDWIWNIRGIQLLPYRLPELVVALEHHRTVWIAEGEKDADRLRAAGVCATTNNGGADNWKPELDEWFNGADVIVVQDMDAAGEKRVANLKQRLEARGCTVRIAQPAAGKDAFDHFAAGFTIDQFVIDGAETTPWPDPIPVGGGYDALPVFPVDVFPDWIADHVRQVAKELQAPIDLPAMLAVTALATCAAKRAEVWLTRSWREQLCLYLVVALPPGAGKSPVFGLILGPLVELETQLLAEALPRIQDQETRRAVVEKQQRKAIDKGETNEALMYGDELRNMKIEPEPRLFVDDVTVEKLGEMLREQGGRLALTSTEGGLFDQMIGRYSEKVKASLDPYLQMWSGDTVRVDRIGRGSVVIDKPALTIGVTVQPTVIAALAQRPELKGRGLTARFMYSLPKSNVGFRNMVVDVDLDPVIQRTYERHLEDLWRNLNTYQTSPLRLEVTPQAKAEFMAWRQLLEQERRPGGILTGLIEWSQKVESSVARLAGLLHIAHGKNSQIDMADMRGALTVGEYWITHAQAVHEMWGTDPVTHAAQQIVRWLDEQELTEFSVRDCYNANRAVMPRAEDALEPLGLLAERGWVMPMFDGPLTVGKRGVPSPRFAVHPDLSSHVRNNHAVMRFMRIETPKITLSPSFPESVNERTATHAPHEPHDPQPEGETATSQKVAEMPLETKITLAGF